LRHLLVAASHLKLQAQLHNIQPNMNASDNIPSHPQSLERHRFQRKVPKATSFGFAKVALRGAPAWQNAATCLTSRARSYDKAMPLSLKVISVSFVQSF
jgi:hypothetical protein